MHFRPIGKTKLMALCSIRHAAAIGIAIAPPAPNSGFRPASGGIYRLDRYVHWILLNNAPRADASNPCLRTTKPCVSTPPQNFT